MWWFHFDDGLHTSEGFDQFNHKLASSMKDAKVLHLHSPSRIGTTRRDAWGQMVQQDTPLVVPFEVVSTCVPEGNHVFFFIPNADTA